MAICDLMRHCALHHNSTLVDCASSRTYSVPGMFAMAVRTRVMALVSVVRKDAELEMVVLADCADVMAVPKADIASGKSPTVRFNVARSAFTAFKAVTRSLATAVELSNQAPSVCTASKQASKCVRAMGGWVGGWVGGWGYACGVSMILIHVGTTVVLSSCAGACTNTNLNVGAHGSDLNGVRGKVLKAVDQRHSGIHAVGNAIHSVCHTHCEVTGLVGGTPGLLHHLRIHLGHGCDGETCNPISGCARHPFTSSKCPTHSDTHKGRKMPPHAPMAASSRSVTSIFTTRAARPWISCSAVRMKQQWRFAP